MFFLKFSNFTPVELNRIAKQAKSSFSKATVVIRFPAKKIKTPVAKKHREVSGKKRWHSPPTVGLSWDSPPPPTESVRGRVR